ncbi:Transglycosylase SLT domain-containing protein [Sulfitobacter brevis]|uniref:Transglycosylase SLT domain-containing protein n=1 Tax=Sulfitobacter brevis TaxID=74348 RepID=A0A1I2DYI6_9RHOB|nr:lytic transglycosylase domain-containing protein [Sulfitobacter brevis]SFE85724.1 Transglycosylase SLT domain-containing protein [Sulfitobacter brevis]
MTRLSLLHRALLCGILASTAGEAVAEGWAGFYRASPVVTAPAATRLRPAAAQGGEDAGVCLRAILDAQLRYEIPDNLLLAIGIQEAGRRIDGNLTIWPWTANADGNGAFFDSKGALESWVRVRQAGGTDSIDVGCMQINQRWHSEHFSSLSEATDPTANVEYAAQFLLRLYEESGDWWDAAGRYHSSTPEFKKIYLEKLAQNSKLANASEFRLAGLPTASATVAADNEPREQPSFNWSADMTGSGAQVMHQVVSIYTATPLQPVLPNYAQVE